MAEEVTIELSNNEALVLFDWITRFNEKEDNSFEDQAEERVLLDLEAALEKSMIAPLSGEYKDLLMKARDQVRDCE